jgi:hypothetical protein
MLFAVSSKRARVENPDGKVPWRSRYRRMSVPAVLASCGRSAGRYPGVFRFPFRPEERTKPRCRWESLPQSRSAYRMNHRISG